MTLSEATREAPNGVSPAFNGEGLPETNSPPHAVLPSPAGDSGEGSPRNSGMPNWITALEEELDKKLLVVLRDGRKLIGYLRTFDQFGNLVLEGTVQRMVVDNAYADLYLGCMIVRGDNMILFGAVDDSRASPLEPKPLCDILAARQAEEEQERQKRVGHRAWLDRQLGEDW
ncbi:LSM domain-containing protein [Toxoplasma gondii TgCatPRC2]|uniref:U6 snRNA-associated Sm-like protein LSm1 n=2 Tax=Toxoplasma gondii TaxID=5811 RepID=A0A151HIN6_TOXGO|nr:LSM domain-containing protein [Toxoplasma gondii RUB]KYK69174.1 LSM domain-containing protein [Toxoplasma gondii TgCatPRC2]